MSECYVCHTDQEKAVQMSIQYVKLLSALKEISESVDRNGEDSSPFYLQDIAEKALKEVGEI